MSTRSGGGGGRRPPGGPGKNPFGSHAHYKEAQAQKDQAEADGDERKELSALKTERKSRAVHGNTKHGGLDTGHQQWNAGLNSRIKQLEAREEERQEIARGPVGADGSRPTPKSSAPLTRAWGSGRIPGTAPKAPSMGLDAFPSLPGSTSSSSSSSHTTPGSMPPIVSPTPSTSTPMAPIPVPRPTSVQSGGGSTTPTTPVGLVPTGSSFSPPVQTGGPSRPTAHAMPPVPPQPKRGGGGPSSSSKPGSGGKSGGGTPPTGGGTGV